MVLPLSSQIIEVSGRLTWLWCLNNESCYTLLWGPWVSEAHLASRWCQSMIYNPRSRDMPCLCVSEVWIRHIFYWYTLTGWYWYLQILLLCFFNYNSLFLLFFFSNFSSWKIWHPICILNLIYPNLAIWSWIHVIYVHCMHACMCEVVDRITCFNLNAVHLLEGTQLNVLIPSYMHLNFLIILPRCIFIFEEQQLNKNLWV
jgi:hypothetical protein